MTERRGRGSSPAGRGDRRTSRGARSRTAADSTKSAGESRAARSGTAKPGPATSGATSGSATSGAAKSSTAKSSTAKPTARPAAAKPTARPAAAKRAQRRRTEEREPAPRRFAIRRGGDGRHDRTILGLSTGKAVILAIVVCALALTLAVPMRTYFAQRAEAAQLAEQRRALESDLDRLRDRRAQQQDPAFIRAEARDRLRLVMPGETPYIVQVPGIEAPPRPAAPTRSAAPDPWYTELWETISQPRPGAPGTTQAPEGPR